MSMPRNPRYFPRMKVRGARRRQLAPYQRAGGAFDRLAISTGKAALALVKMRAALEGATQ